MRAPWGRCLAIAFRLSPEEVVLFVGPGRGPRLHPVPRDRTGCRVCAHADEARRDAFEEGVLQVTFDTSKDGEPRSIRT